MPDPTITTIDNASVALGNNEFRDDGVKFSGADTYVEGTVLGRKLVSDTIAIAYTRAGSSDYTATASCNAGETLEVGNYVVTAGTLTAGVGTWTCVAPSGKHEQFTSTAADDDLEFPNLGITFAVTAGDTAWDTGDIITATVSAESGLPLVAYVKGTGTNGAQVPKAVMPYGLTATGAGTLAARPIVGGRVNADRLVIDADGDATNVDDAVLDMLKASGIDAISVTQLAKLDPGAS